MNNSIYELINSQLNNEFRSVCIYRNLAGIAKNIKFNGLFKWLKIQADEELEHFKKFYDYLISVDRDPVIKSISLKEISNIETVESILVYGLEYEKKIQTDINQLYKKCISEDDFLTMKFLDYFIIEQNEEVNLFIELLEKYNVSKNNLLLFDTYLDKREK